MDDNFVKVIEYEYAVKYLELMGIEPTTKMIAKLLKNTPLSSCEISSGWSNTGWLADVLYIYPNKSYKENLDSIKPATDTSLGKEKAKDTHLKKQVDFHEHVEKIYNKALKVHEEAKTYKTKLSSDKRTEGKMEPSIDPVYWKENFLFPFALKKPPVPKSKGVEEDGTLIDEDEFKFPLHTLEHG